MQRLLVYTHDLQLRIVLGPALGAEFRLVVESDSQRCKELMLQGACDVLILDIDGASGACVTGVLEAARRGSLPVVAMAADHNSAAALDLVERGVFGWIRRSPVPAEVKGAVHCACQPATPRCGGVPVGMPQPKAGGCDGLIGNGWRATAVYDLIRRVCGLDAFVLITGESGTGKELIARAIHNLSRRKKSPFVTVSCGAIPETLIEAELFGYEKGAFTGAFGKRVGYLEQAGEGTLLLDEIGELSLHTQVKLLRVLQEKEFSRLGSSEAIPLRARVVFATHRNLAEMVREGTFRQDLYYRVNVMGIQAPALRERAEDIPALASHFLARYAESYGSGVKTISDGAMALLLQHAWPGNIRELENVMQRALIVSDRAEIRAEHLPDTVRGPDHPGLLELHAASFEEQLQAFKLALARKAIHECNGNKTQAAQTLQISRTYLHRLIRQPGEPELEEVGGE